MPADLVLELGGLHEQSPATLDIGGELRSTEQGSSCSRRRTLALRTSCGLLQLDDDLLVRSHEGCCAMPYGAIGIVGVRLGECPVSRNPVRRLRILVDGRANQRVPKLDPAPVDANEVCRRPPR